MRPKGRLRFPWDPVFLIDVDHFGLVFLGFLEFQLTVGDDYQQVPHLSQSCRRTVQADGSGILLPHEDVGLEPGTVVEIDHLNLLVGENIGRV